MHHASGETALITQFPFSSVMGDIPRDPQAGELILGQSEYSGQEKTMRLTFTKSSEDPVIVTLSVDASPGCGGIVWPAGQVLIFHHPPPSMFESCNSDPVQLPRTTRPFFPSR